MLTSTPEEGLLILAFWNAENILSCFYLINFGNFIRRAESSEMYLPNYPSYKAVLVWFRVKWQTDTYLACLKVRCSILHSRLL